MTKRNKPRGLHAHRLRPDTTNPRERAFMEQWDWEHEAKYGRDLLGVLFGIPCTQDDEGAVREYGTIDQYRQYPLGLPTSRDRIVAATVVQWLGTNVGLSFLFEALRRVGYEIQWPEHPTKLARRKP